MTDVKRRQRVFKVLVGLVVLGVLALVLLCVFVLSVFSIPSVSMQPTLKVGDRILVNRQAYRVGNIKRGDIVTINRPPGETDASIRNIVKRVIGLPGDEVSFKDGAVLLNGIPLIEPYLAPGERTDPKGADVIKVPPGQVLVLGDNRRNSTDSRVFGAFDTSLIVGKVICTLHLG
jgi:signal peptidase I